MDDFGFEEFWHQYPRREGNPKQPAREEWARLKKRGELPALEVMIHAIRSYTSQLAKDHKLNTSYVAHARTWLHQKRWQDFEPKAAPVVLTAAVLPHGYEDAARALIAKIGTGKWLIFFGNAQWSNGGDIIKIKADSRFSRETIEINYVEDLERFTGKQVEVTL